MLELTSEGRPERADHPVFEGETSSRLAWRAAAKVPSSSASIRIAKSQDDLTAIGRLRYEYFVERDRKPYAHADHELQTLLEPVDGVSLNFCVEIDERVVAAVRLTRAADAHLDSQLSAAVFHAGLGPTALCATVINSKLVVREEMRARLYVPELFRMVYRVGRVAQAQHCIAAARPAVIPLFERFGFVTREGSYQCAVAGTMQVAILDALDRRRLAAVRSPLLSEFEAPAACQERSVSP